MKSYRIIFVLCIFILLTLVSPFIFSQTEAMGGRGELNNKNRICQTEYLQKIQGILMGPSVDSTTGYLSNKDVLSRISAVDNSCEWNNQSEIEKKYAKFKEKLANTDNPKQLNELLIAIR